MDALPGGAVALPGAAGAALTDIAFAPGGHLLAAGGRDGQARSCACFPWQVAWSCAGQEYFDGLAGQVHAGIYRRIAFDMPHALAKQVSTPRPVASL